MGMFLLTRVSLEVRSRLDVHLVHHVSCRLEHMRELSCALASAWTRYRFMYGVLGLQILERFT